MSITHIAAVWDRSRAKLGARLVALALADEIRTSTRAPWDRDGKPLAVKDQGEKGEVMPVCWPGKEHLAAITRLDERTVDRKVEELRALGEVIILSDQKQGRELAPLARQALGKSGSSNLYILTVGTARATIRRVEGWLRGGIMPPRQNARGIGAEKGGHPRRCPPSKCPPIRSEEPGMNHEARARDLLELPDWMRDGAAARFARDGKSHDGTLRLDGEGELYFHSPTMPWTRQNARVLLGHLEPLTLEPATAATEAP